MKGRKITQRLRVQTEMLRHRQYSGAVYREFPNDSGYALRLVADGIPPGAKAFEEQVAENAALIRRHIKEGHFTILATPTLILGDNPDEIIQKLRRGEGLSPEEGGAIWPGHISIYTNEQSLSHRPGHRKSNEPFMQDVKDSMMQKGSHSFIIVVPTENFPEASFARKPGEYSIYARGETDNCATAVQKVLLNTKDRGKMNPLSTANWVLYEAFRNSMPLENQYVDYDMAVAELGIGKGIISLSKEFQHNIE